MSALKSPSHPIPKPVKGPVAVLIGTRKGAFILRGDKTRRAWKLSVPIFLGHIVHHMALDPRDGRTLLIATRTGHLGPTVFRSTGVRLRFRSKRLKSRAAKNSPAAQHSR